VTYPDETKAALQATIEVVPVVAQSLDLLVYFEYAAAVAWAVEKEAIPW
jgi:hypothetical protein